MLHSVCHIHYSNSVSLVFLCKVSRFKTQTVSACFLNWAFYATFLSSGKFNLPLFYEDIKARGKINCLLYETRTLGLNQEIRSWCLLLKWSKWDFCGHHVET